MSGFLCEKKKVLQRKILKSQFNFEKEYRFFSLLTCPFYLMRKNLYKNIKKLAPFLRGTVLDFGCGNKPYRHLFTNCTRYIGVDIENAGHNHENEKVDYYYDGITLPFRDEAFDNVFSSEVIEHIDCLDNALDEINRVMKSGGLFLVTTPFVWNENELPNDFARYTSCGLEKILIKHGFEVVKQIKSSNYVEILFQMISEYYRYQFQKENAVWWNRFIQLFLIMPNNIIGAILSKLLPQNTSWFGNNIFLCKKI